MLIDVRRFVDIDIKGQRSAFVNSSRPSVAVIYNGDFSGEIDSNTNLVTLATTHANIAKAATVFFGCGGKKLKVYGNVNLEKAAILAKVSDIPTDEIVVTYVHSDNSNLANIAKILSDVANDYSLEEYGIKDKIFIVGVNQTSTIIQTIEYHGVRNLVWKYMSNLQSMQQFSIAAYLSKLDISKSDSVHDYCYTAEPLEAQITDDATFETLSENNINVDIYLANAVRNIGGNCLDGSDLINTYVRIILQQTVTEQLLILLGAKLNDRDAVGRIFGTITKELERYLLCGYLTKGKIWTNEDMEVVGADRSYTVIKRGTPLTNGYYLSILPLSALSEADRLEHKAPPIYLILAEQYGIRTITINGEVI